MTAVTDGPFKIKNRGTVLILLFTAIVASGLFFLMQLHNTLNYSFATVRTDNSAQSRYSNLLKSHNIHYAKLWIRLWKTRNPQIM